MNEVPEKEHEFFWRMANEYQLGLHAKVFALMWAALDDKTITFVNIKDIHSRCEEIFKYLYLGKRFDELVAKSNDDLSAMKEGFKIFGLTYETLDEVERVLKLKAFI